MRYLKYFILAIILFNAPSFLLLELRQTGLASGISYISFLLLIVYYFFSRKGTLLWPFILIGATYYLFSALQPHIPFGVFFIEAIKFFIVIICGNELSRRCNSQELIYFLLIGAASVLIQPVFFPSDTGRLSGLYLNPNSAGFVCIVGYSLSYAIQKKYLKLTAQIIFTFVGLLTFSRTFILLWILVNFLSLFVSIKNARIFIIGFCVIAALVAFSETLGLSGSIRMNQLNDAINGKAKVNELNDDSRTDTWAQYYFTISNNPIWGSGIGALRSDEEHDQQGVHNTYLLVWGEAGLLAFIIFASTFISLTYRGVRLIKKHLHLTLLSCSIALYLLTNHNFFNDNIIIFFCVWSYNAVNSKNKKLGNEKVSATQLKNLKANKITTAAI